MNSQASWLDETADEAGAARPHWQPLLAAFRTLPGGGLAEVAARLDRAFGEEGITGLLPGGPGRAGNWRCDPVPLILTAGEFATLEAGLAQRARLLEAILIDLYGPRTLLAAGALPPALVYANPGFLRACSMHGSHRRRPLLHFYAADLVRAPDGRWQVLADRTDGAAGVGYARENRRILARVLPEGFRAHAVRQSGPFFEAWAGALRRLAPDGRPDPRVALLSPGTGHPLWFEHMYLSRELSCSLVEAADLTVRGGQVFLKTLRGLVGIDVILRRTDGFRIDPLEFTGGGTGGVPGLMDALRGGAVRMVNDPGTALVQAPGLAPFLPALAERLLGEPLRLSSVPSMWLGDPDAHERLAASATDGWLIRPATEGDAPATPLNGAGDAGADLLARIAARPWAYAATTAVAPSTVPCVTPAGLVAKPVALRMYLVQGADGRWQAMPGGLGRVMDTPGRLTGWLPRHGLSKDVWVLKEDGAPAVAAPAVALPPMPVRRSMGDLPSRAADDLYWLGRYVERLEEAARLIRATLVRLTRGTPRPGEAVGIGSLAACLAEAGIIDAAVAAAPPGTAALPDALLRAVGATGPVGELFGHVGRMADAVRDRLTGDMYMHLTQTLRSARSDAQRVGRSLDALLHACVGIVRFSAGVAGFAAENLVRGGGLLFLDLGRRVERAQAVAASLAGLLDVAPEHTEDGLRLALEVCDSLLTYRARYLTVIQAGPVLDLVLADRTNPRALAFQLAAAAAHLRDIGGPDDALAGEAAAMVDEVEALVVRVVAAGAAQTGEAVRLPATLHAIADRIGRLSDAVGRRYFALLPATHALGLGEGERPAAAHAA